VAPAESSNQLIALRHTYMGIRVIARSDTPSVFKTITWDQDYATIRRYQYMIELANAWPQGFQNGQRDACAAGTVRHGNGGGCAPASTPATVYVGPHAAILPGAQVTGTARIEDQAIVANGTVSGGTVGGLSVVGETGGPGTNNAFTVSGSAQVRTTFAQPATLSRYSAGVRSAERDFR